MPNYLIAFVFGYGNKGMMLFILWILIQVTEHQMLPLFKLSIKMAEFLLEKGYEVHGTKVTE